MIIYIIIKWLRLYLASIHQTKLKQIYTREALEVIILDSKCSKSSSHRSKTLVSKCIIKFSLKKLNFEAQLLDLWGIRFPTKHKKEFNQQWWMNIKKWNPKLWEGTNLQIIYLIKLRSFKTNILKKLFQPLVKRPMTSKKYQFWKNKKVLN